MVTSGATFTGTCYCENGQASSLESACSTDGDHNCETCDSGFTKVEKASSSYCVATECFCDGSSVDLVGIAKWDKKFQTADEVPKNRCFL